MDLTTLWPLSQREIEHSTTQCVDRWFEDAISHPFDESPGGADVWDRVLKGGFPEALARSSPERRSAWFTSYATTILQRDVRDLANIEGLSTLPQILALLATRTTGLLNTSDLSRSLSIPQMTLRRYLTLLTTTFLICRVPPWTSNLGLRLVKAAKVILVDTGLASDLLSIDRERLLAEPNLRGPLLENFVAMELTKQASWSKLRPALYHFRTRSGRDVDLLMEDRRGRVVGVEIKASTTVGSQDLRGLRTLAEMIGERFHRGIVLYTGEHSLPLGDRLMAEPISNLWRGS